METTTGLFSRVSIIVGFLGLIAALPQFASNVLLPALPEAAAHLNSSMAVMQQALSIYLLAIGFSDVIYGPLSDRYGRRLPLIGGLILFMFGTALAAVADSVLQLLIARAIQGFGAAAGSVLATAIARDLFNSAALARVLSFITIILAVVPGGGSPLIGGVLTDLFGWQSIFWATFLLGAVILIGTFRFPETHERPTENLPLRATLSALVEVFGNRLYRGYALVSALSLGALYSFLAGSPEVLISHFHLTPTDFGLMAPIGAVGVILGGAASVRAAGRTPPARLAKFSLILMAVGPLVVIAPGLVGIESAALVIAMMFIHFAGIGAIMPSMNAAAMSAVTRNVGAASSLLNIMQTLAAVLATILVSALQAVWPVYGLPIVILVFTLAAATVLRRATAQQRAGASSLTMLQKTPAKP